ncbi:SET and MYND domain-containing protein 5 [Trichonephila inaurata madagascariensis]|uniref:SET and MYND domain-containing protein 5 n=1 Tax=Trichonephila inaurata madagascariensis TaxID=2747483 RepID=A0A8X6WSJ6_9ARAC|nr:SET and MYND domain-containing protein 5 [Trichonephila inaurata madagascariensis]
MSSLGSFASLESDNFTILQTTGLFLNNEGSGLYPLQSSCNHSCVPNAEATFPYNNFTLVMEAIKEIQPGEEIIVCYLDECNRNRSRHSRIKLLRENYLFSCTCPKCENQINDEDITSESDADGD